MTDFDEYYAEMLSEAEAQGPETLSGIRALETFYRLTMDLRDLRLERGLTQKQLAAKTGIGQPEISRIEGGQTNVTVATLGALAAALGAEVKLVPASE